MGGKVNCGSPLAGSAHTQHPKKLRVHHLNQQHPNMNYPDIKVKQQSLMVSVQIC